MKLLEAWRYSRIPYKEVVYRSIAEERGRMWWGGFGRGRISADQINDLELTKKALRIAKWDKLLVAIFNVLAAVIPFTAQFFGSPLLGLTSAVSLSLAVTFGFTALYAIQTLSSFVSAESAVLLATLPIAQNDFSLVTLLSFVRSVDYMVVGSIVSQVALVAFLTGSPVAVLVMLVASVVNAILAVAASLWFSRVFTKNLSQGGRSKSSTFLRLLFILMWGSLLLGVSFLISLPWYIVPSLELILLNSTQLPSTFLSLVHPFSAGITIANINNPIAAGSMALIAAISMIGYIIISGFAGKWILKTVKQISSGTDVKQSRMITKDFSIKIHNPLFAYIIKDLKISSRNPATAFFFALPVVETAIVSLLSLNLDVLRASTLLVSTFMGGIFVLLMPFALLNSEGQGLEYTKTLPLDVNRIILSKTIISMLTYIPVPMVLCIMAFLKPLTSPLALLIPFIVILSIVSASIFQIQLFLKTVTKGKISALIHDLKKLIVGFTTLLIPIVTYSIIYLISFSHFFAVLSMSVATVLMLSIAIFQLQQNKKQ